ncbi:AraC family transcriptional regulator [Domibacillus robiginosus]|uniref:AraC family transcriptional regulator n=1 Tax=Domibacillus robiginosus TaxID=1071054 RepID=UPI00067C7D91|nr:GyrI-like domain-containing protein [Domibacillus robiginosus]
MTKKIETLPKSRIAYVRQVGPYGFANIQAMQTLKKWTAENDLLSETSIVLEVSQDNLETTLPENCRDDACIVLSEDDQIDDFMSESELCGGNYAIYKVKHAMEDIQKAWGCIVSELSNSGYQIDDRPSFERYERKLVSNHQCEICVPIK